MAEKKRESTKTTRESDWGHLTNKLLCLQNQFPKLKAWSTVIHDLGCCCNSADSRPTWFIFHSTCFFKVSITIKHGPFIFAGLFFLPVARKGFILSFFFVLNTRASPAYEQQPTRFLCDVVTEHADMSTGCAAA